VTVKDKQVKGRDLVDPVKRGRKIMQDDLMQRWVTELTSPALVNTPCGRKRGVRKNERLRKYMISTLLDPRYKLWDFKGHEVYDTPESTGKLKAQKHLKSEWMANWAPSAAAPIHDEAAEVVVVEDEDDTPGGAGGMSSNDLFDDSDDDAGDDSDDDVATAAAVADLTRRMRPIMDYLEMPKAPNKSLVLDWWHDNERHIPRVCLMWRQFHARPASSAGVERWFSGASMMHAANAKNMKSETIGAFMMTEMNYDDPYKGNYR